MQTFGINQTIESRENRVRVAIGGDKLEHEGSMSTTLATLTAVKTHLNKTMCAKEATHVIVDIKDFYCVTPMQKFDHGHLPMELIPQEIT